MRAHPYDGRVLTLLASPIMLRRAALASLITNVGIVITGGAVRLTGSGLGCPTVPRCTDASYVPTAEMGIHGVIEFSNRMLTFVVGLAAVVGIVCALLQKPRRARPVRLAVLVFLGVCAQAVLGAITVRTQLNPEVVGGHFIVSMGLLAAAYAFWRSTVEGDGPVVVLPLRSLAWLLTAASLAVLVAGTLVTGAGPHAGDANARRNGLDFATITQLHADLVFLLVGLAVGTWFALRAVGARAAMVRAGWLLGIIAAQGLVGFVQYLTNLPPLIVGAHMAGACAVWLGTLSVLYATRSRIDTQDQALPDRDPAEATPITSVTAPSTPSVANTAR
jgi:cytochrome c oxidase assembly protein subunit 15